MCFCLQLSCWLVVYVTIKMFYYLKLFFSVVFFISLHFCTTLKWTESSKLLLNIKLSILKCSKWKWNISFFFCCGLQMTIIIIDDPKCNLKRETDPTGHILDVSHFCKSNMIYFDLFSIPINNFLKASKIDCTN